MCKPGSALVSLIAPLIFILVSQVRLEAFQSTKLEVTFEGNKVFSSQQLVEETNQCLSQDSKWPSEYNPQMLDYCLRIVQTSLTGRGYLRAEFGEPKKQQSESGLKIKVPLQEGPLYRLGEISIAGAKVFSQEQLIEMLHLTKGDIARGDAIREWLFENIKKAYADRGYINYAAEPELHFRPVPNGESEGVVDLQVEIEEARRFIVRRILFEGNAHTRDEVIRNALLVREGDFFSQHSYDESIKKLNLLGLFEEIDSVKDMDMNSVGLAGSPKIDLIIHLKEKVRP